MMSDDDDELCIYNFTTHNSHVKISNKAHLYQLQLKNDDTFITNTQVIFFFYLS